MRRADESLGFASLTASLRGRPLSGACRPRRLAVSASEPQHGAP